MKQFIFGNDLGLMPDLHFRLMALIIRAREAIFRYSNLLSMIIIDYMCGPGAYLSKAAELVGEAGSGMWLITSENIDHLQCSPISRI